MQLGVLQALSGKVAALGVEQIRGLELSLKGRQHTIGVPGCLPAKVGAIFDKLRRKNQ